MSQGVGFSFVLQVHRGHGSAAVNDSTGSLYSTTSQSSRRSLKDVQFAQGGPCQHAHRERLQPAATHVKQLKEAVW